ncbi:MAG TPA: magnesium/cobalt transporter CorA [Acidimicrobiales bacterium]|nr:magnesium/cobalt transporter CorA [Acidimicrobiales bacterium]
MITARVYHGGDVKEIDSADISEVLGEPDRMLWVDVSDPIDTDLECLQDEFGLHPLAIEDVRHRHQRPKLEKYPGHDFVVAYTAGLQEVDIFIGPSWVVSVRERDSHGPAWSIEGVLTRFEGASPKEATPGFLLYVLLDVLVDGWFAVTEASEDALEELEDRIFGEHDDDQDLSVQQAMFDTRRRLLTYRRAIAPLREVVGSLMRREVRWIDGATATNLQDVYDHVLRAVDHLDSQRELLDNAVDAHLAMTSHRVNRAMERMTAWGAILLGATLVAGIYGMNFDHMPELGWSHGYLWALGVMATITIVGYRYFKGKGWL